MSRNQQIAQEITDRIITQIEQGVAPWRKNWVDWGGLPVNITTGRYYRGINVMQLAFSPFTDPRWGTFKAMQDAAEAQARREGRDLVVEIVKRRGRDTKQIWEIIKGERVRLVAAGDCKSDLACWRGKLADQDPRVRDRAVWQLGWTGDKAVFDDMLKAAQDNDPMVRMAAVLSLRRIADPDLVKLKELSEGWSKRLDYQMVNMEIQRLIALVESRRK